MAGFEVPEPIFNSTLRGTAAVPVHPGGSVANYVPVDNYLVMLDEGRKFNLNEGA